VSGPNSTGVLLASRVHPRVYRIQQVQLRGLAIIELQHLCPRCMPGLYEQCVDGRSVRASAVVHRWQSPTHYGRSNSAIDHYSSSTHPDLRVCWNCQSVCDWMELVVAERGGEKMTSTVLGGKLGCQLVAMAAYSLRIRCVVVALYFANRNTSSSSSPSAAAAVWC
jgi:hypothetical protein